MVLVRVPLGRARLAGFIFVIRSIARGVFNQPPYVYFVAKFILDKLLLELFFQLEQCLGCAPVRMDDDFFDEVDFPKNVQEHLVVCLSQPVQ